jgi:PilZ domain
VERREFARYTACLEIETREAGASSPCKGNTTDVSLAGCYVATIFPLAVGSQVQFTLWAGDDNIQGRGIVQTCHPGIGMGIQFLSLNYPERRRLAGFLRATTRAASQAALSPYLR